MVTIVPDEAELLQISRLAQTQHLQLLTDGKRTVLSPHPIPGFRPMVVKLKSRRLAA